MNPESSVRTVAVGLIGRGIARSASPQIHEAEAAELGLPLTYRLVDFDRLGLSDASLGPTLDLLCGIGFAGVNITHPFKQEVIHLLDEVDEVATALGAVNCVRFDNDRKIGSNSDWIGFGWLLESELPAIALDRVAQFGAGGAGSATAYALLRAGVTELRLFDPAADKARELAERMGALFPRSRVLVADDPRAALAGATGIVQTTPVGMAEHPGVPFDPCLFEDGQWLADIIYFPRETELVLAAKRRGLRAVGGEAMAIGQAAEPFRLFTGLVPDRTRMKRAMQSRDAAAARFADQSSMQTILSEE